MVVPSQNALLAEGERFELIGAVTPAGFQDRCIKPGSAILPKYFADYFNSGRPAAP